MLISVKDLFNLDVHADFAFIVLSPKNSLYTKSVELVRHLRAVANSRQDLSFKFIAFSPEYNFSAVSANKLMTNTRNAILGVLKATSKALKELGMEELGMKERFDQRVCLICSKVVSDHLKDTSPPRVNGISLSFIVVDPNASDVKPCIEFCKADREVQDATRVVLANSYTTENLNVEKIREAFALANLIAKNSTLRSVMYHTKLALVKRIIETNFRDADLARFEVVPNKINDTELRMSTATNAY